MEKLIITVNPAGKANFLSAPDMTVARNQVAAALEAHNAGAAIVHLHGNMLPGQGVREPDLGHWREMTEMVRAKSDMVVQFGRAVMKPKVRRDLLTLRPDMGSFLLGHHDAITQAGPLHSMSTLEEQQEWARYHGEFGVLPEFEVWHPGNIWNLQQLIAAELVKPPHYATLFFGHPGGHWSPTTSEEMDRRVSLLPAGTQWGVSVRGPQQVAMHTLAIIKGGHVRVGFEDEPDLYPGKPARSNAELVERIVRLARELGREVATPADVRQMLALPRRMKNEE